MLLVAMVDSFAWHRVRPVSRPCAFVRHSLWLTAVVFLCAAATFPPLRADTILQTDAQGQRRVIQRNAIVVREDSSSISYKHFDLKEQRVVKVTLDQGSLPYDADRSKPGERQQIVALWKRFGFTASVTDAAGKTTRVFDAYLDFYPPGGRGSLLESVPPRNNFPISLDGGGADLVDFTDIAQIDFAGDHLKITLTSGQVKQGKFLTPTEKPAEARFLGITDHYDPASPE
ncbi:MAG: hypothetical protein ACRD2O_17925, partial [Terriglobia bacterium]